LIGSSKTIGLNWDASFVNTLIDAADFDSFVDSYRMRGRVIHADKAHPNKTAHIWHLVTMEQPYKSEDITKLRLASRLTYDTDGGLASDYRHMQRRFECYLGPNFQTGELENGIDRLGMKTIPNGENIDSINSIMLERAANRDKLPHVWNDAIEDTTKPISEIRVPKKAKVPVFTPKNTLLTLGSLIGLIGGISAISFLVKALILYIFFNSGLVVSAAVVAVLMMLVASIAVVVISTIFILYFFPLSFHHLTASRSIKSLSRCILKTLKDIGMVNKRAIMVMEALPGKKGYRLYIDNCSHDEQIIFQKSVEELLSPISYPRYILVRGGWFNRLLWKWSFTCPSIMAKNDAWVKTFEKHIRRSMGRMKFQYTRRDPGRKHLIFARNKSYLNEYNKSCEKRNHLLKNEIVL
jgi:hypothetical protein